MKIMNYAEEAIGFQSPAVKILLIDIMQRLIDAKFQNNADANKSPLKAELEKLVHTETGITLEVKHDAPYYGIAIGVDLLHPNNVIHNDFARAISGGDYNDILLKAAKEKQSGHVDLKNARVSGWMSDVSYPLFFDYMENCRGAFTAEELAAVIAHEIGHAFVNFEMVTHSMRTNQVLAAVHKANMANLNQEEYTVFLKKAGDVIGDENSLIELSKTKDARTITTVILAESFRDITNALGTPNYDATAFEQCADQFAARLGLGRALATGLEKVSRRYGYPEYSSATRIFITMNECVVAFGLPVAAVCAAVTGLAGLAVMAGGLWALFTLMSGDGSRDMTYDDLKVRYKRIREQMITYLKNPKVDPKDAKQVLHDIAIVDKVIDDAKEYKGVLRILGNWIWSSNRKEAKAIELQRQLEELAANDLYKHAASLRTMNA